MLTVWVEIALMVATWIGQIQKIRLMVVEINHRGGGAERLRERGRAKAPEECSDGKCNLCGEQDHDIMVECAEVDGREMDRVVVDDGDDMKEVYDEGRQWLCKGKKKLSQWWNFVTIDFMGHQ
ncbi:hypothetical protein JHK82_042847 [Glycine max]|nr:hypothetical protein JHK82_042847 [Glycine max]KAG5116951.1 hypothetical protein JHK84_043064 [Glycine max]